MGVVAHVVCAAVPDVGPYVLEPGAHADLPQLLEVVPADLLVHAGHGQTGAEGLEHVVGGPVGALVEELLPLGEPAIERPATGHVVDLVVPAGPHVVENHVPVAGLSPVLVVVDAEVVLSRGDDRGESGGENPPLGQGVVELRLELVLIDAVPGGAHHGQDAVPGNGLRVAHGLDLAGLFDGALAGDTLMDVLQADKGVVRPQPRRQLEGLPHRLLINAPPVKVQADGGQTAGDQLLQVGEKFAVGPDILQCGTVPGLLLGKPPAIPPLQVVVLGQQEQGLADAVCVLADRQNAVRLLNARVVDKGPVREKGVVLVAGLAGGASAEEQEQAARRQGGVELLPVLLVK